MRPRRPARDMRLPRGEVYVVTAIVNGQPVDPWCFQDDLDAELRMATLYEWVQAQDANASIQMYKVKVCPAGQDVNVTL